MIKEPGVDTRLDQVNLVLQKYLFCLKSQQNLNRVIFIFFKFINFYQTIHFLCILKKLFNRLCTQTMFNLLNLISKLYKNPFVKESSISDLALSIIKYGLLSKFGPFIKILKCFFRKIHIKFWTRSHSNIYIEFFKNLPSSFSPRSNYQVVIFFNTIQAESVKNVSL